MPPAHDTHAQRRVSRQAHSRGNPRRGVPGLGELGSSRVERVDRASSLKIMNMLQKGSERRGGRRERAAEAVDDPQAPDPYQFTEDGEARRPAVVRTYARNRLPTPVKGSTSSPAAVKTPPTPRRDPAKPCQILESMKMNFNESSAPGAGGEAVETAMAALATPVATEGTEQKPELKPGQKGDMKTEQKCEKAERRSPTKRVRPPRKPVTDDEGLDRVIEEVIRSWAAEEAEDKAGEVASKSASAQSSQSEPTASSPTDSKTKAEASAKDDQPATKNGNPLRDDSADLDKEKGDLSSTSACDDVSTGGASGAGSDAPATGAGAAASGETPTSADSSPNSKPEPPSSKPASKPASKQTGPRCMPSDVEAQLADWDA